MKKLICIFLFLTLLLSGCSAEGSLVQEGKAYNIYRKGEQYYIRVNPGYTTGYGLPNIGNNSVKFDSIQQMRDKILTGDFTHDQIRGMTYQATSVHEFEIVNPFRMYELHVPNNYTMIMDHVEFSVDSYMLEYREENKKDYSLITARIVMPDRYSELVAMYNSSYKADFNEENHTVIKDETDPVSGNRRVIYTDGNFRWCIEFVRHTTPERELYAKVTRQLDKDWKMLNTGSIRLYGKENGGYYDIHIYDAVISGLVDISFLSQFGITPYDGNEPSPEAIG